MMVFRGRLRKREAGSCTALSKDEIIVFLFSSLPVWTNKENTVHTVFGCLVWQHRRQDETARDKPIVWFGTETHPNRYAHSLYRFHLQNRPSETHLWSWLVERRGGFSSHRSTWYKFEVLMKANSLNPETRCKTRCKLGCGQKQVKFSWCSKKSWRLV